MRRDRFIEEMESYTKQVEEFQSNGDMSEISKYLRKAQALDNKLQAAAEKVMYLNYEKSFFILTRYSIVIPFDAFEISFI